MLKSPNDRRAIRTKIVLRNALSELINKKGFNEISITDLTRIADINRGTFYLHYADKYDLLEQSENEIIQEIKEHTKDIGCIDMLDMESIDEPLPMLVRLFQCFKENAIFLKAILGPNGDPTFHGKLKKLMETNLFENKFFNTYKQENMIVPKEYLISYVLSADLGVIQQWLESDMQKSPEEMALILSRMFLLGPMKAAGFKSRSDI